LGEKKDREKVEQAGSREKKKAIERGFTRKRKALVIDGAR
jgi:hypothetical protein